MNLLNKFCSKGFGLLSCFYLLSILFPSDLGASNTKPGHYNLRIENIINTSASPAKNGIMENSCNADCVANNQKPAKVAKEQNPAQAAKNQQPKKITKAQKPTKAVKEYKPVKEQKFYRLDSLYKIDSTVFVAKSALRKIQEKAFNLSLIQAKNHSATSDIASLLRNVSGIKIRTGGGLGSNTSLSINGFQGKQIKIFLDGVPISDFGGAFQLNNIPMALASRVEVYKGVVPISLGADALGGAVNIVSKIYNKSHINFSYSFGSFNTHKSYLNAAYVSPKNWAFESIFYQNYSDNNYKVTVPLVDLQSGTIQENQHFRKFHNAYHNENLILKFSLLNKPYADRLTIGLMLANQANQIQNGARGRKVYGAWHQKRRFLMPTFYYTKKNLFVDNLNLNVNASLNMGQLLNIDTSHVRYNWAGQHIHLAGKGGEQRYGIYDFRNINALTITNLTYKLSANHLFSLNNTNTFDMRRGRELVAIEENRYDLPERNIKNVLGLNYSYTSDKYNLSLFAKDYFQFSDHSTVFSIRGSTFENDIQESAAKSNYIGYGLAFSSFLYPNFELKSSYEKTYRLPENIELFGDMTFLDSNPDLKPEESHNLNLGFSSWHYMNSSNIHIDINSFARLANGFISPEISGQDFLIKMVNTGKIICLGVDSDISYSYAGIFNLSLNCTYQNLRNFDKYLPDSHTENITYLDRVPNVPYLFANIHASYQLPFLSNSKIKTRLAYDMAYVHDFYLYWPSLGFSNTKHVIPMQLSHNMSLRFSYLTNWELGFYMRNLLNAPLYDNFGQEKPGFNFSIELKYRYIYN